MPLSLGQLLVKEEYLTEAQLQKALDYRTENRARLGDACIKLNLITESNLLDVLALQFRIPRLELEHFSFEPEALAWPLRLRRRSTLPFKPSTLCWGRRRPLRKTANRRRLKKLKRTLKK